jgi:DNA-binding transcriptional LysR family regulator
MELRHIRYFLAVAEEREFHPCGGQARHRPAAAQPTDPRPRKRDRRGAVSSRAARRRTDGGGCAFLPEARAAIASAEKAKLAAQRATRGETGRLALGFTASSAFNTAVSGTIRRFRGQWPDVGLSLTEMNSNWLMEKLMRQEIDAAFIRPGLEDPKDV